jgi:hypothetical protein
LPVICVETRHMKAALSAQINKSDRNDARGIAQMTAIAFDPKTSWLVADAGCIKSRSSVRSSNGDLTLPRPGCWR